MPKAYRGGKGRVEPPLTENQREFDEIDRTPEGIAVIRVKNTVKNTTLPLYSNSKDAVYFSLGKNGTNEPFKIGIYHDYQIVRSIHFDKVRGNHYHLWGPPTVKRGKMTITRKDGDFFDLSANDKHLIQKFIAWSVIRNGSS